MKIHFLIKITVLILFFVPSYLFCDGVAYKGYKKINSKITKLNSDDREEDKNVSHPHIPGPGRSKRPTNAPVTSTNWGGYVAANNLTNAARNSVSAVYGSWIVPSVSKIARTDTYCAIWIGIDGYTSPTVEQIGTAHDIVGGVAQHYAWFEMYPGGSYLINNFPVNVGDVISASVEYSGNNIFTMHIYNDTKKVYFTVPTSYTTSSTALRNCAEWIVEAPYYNGILPLTNFGTAYLWGCIANINGTLANIQNNVWKNTAITMVTNSNVTKALSSDLLPDKGSFFVTWKHQ
jgi:hypothetical protein